MRLYNTSKWMVVMTNELSVELMFFNAFDDKNLFCIFWLSLILPGIYQTTKIYNQNISKCSRIAISINFFSLSPL